MGDKLTPPCVSALKHLFLLSTSFNFKEKTILETVCIVMINKGQRTLLKRCCSLLVPTYAAFLDALPIQYIIYDVLCIKYCRTVLLFLSQNAQINL